MGVRLYNPATGRFLQVDPVLGGSDNPYDYARHDPVNIFDLDGRQATNEGGSVSRTVKAAKFWKKIFDKINKVKKYAQYIWAVAKYAWANRMLKFWGEMDESERQISSMETWTRVRNAWATPAATGLTMMGISLYTWIMKLPFRI